MLYFLYRHKVFTDKEEFMLLVQLIDKLRKYILAIVTSATQVFTIQNI